MRVRLRRRLKRLSLTGWIFAGMAAGTVAGWVWPAAGGALSPLIEIFLRLVKSLIAPLLFATLVSGIAAGASRATGRVGLKSLVYFQAVTTIALLIGFGAGVLLEPGTGMAASVAPESAARGAARSVAGLASTLERSVPASFAGAMARGDVLQIVVFSLLFGMACAAAGAKAKPVTDFADSLGAVMFRYTHWVMYAAPLAAAGGMALTVSQHGPRALSAVGRFVLIECGAELGFVACVLLPAALLARVPLKRFVGTVRQPAAVAFSTASSDAALPLALDNMGRFGVPGHILGLVLPAGYSLNLAGTALHVALASIFVVQAAGARLAREQQVAMILTLMLTSKGVAAVPRSSYLIVMGTVAEAGVPPEAAGIILGADALLDMLRTTVNLIGNCLATAVIARWEGVAFRPDEAVPDAASESRLF